MNMTRRKFFRGVAIGLPAAVIASKLPALPALTLEPPYKFQTTISTSLPTGIWRQLYAGENPYLGYNKILAEMKWIEK